MKKSTKYIIFIIFICVGSIVYTCNFTKYKYSTWPKYGLNHYTENIKQSKIFKVLLEEYEAEYDTYRILHSLLYIKESWLEKCWNSTYIFNEVDQESYIEDCAQLLMKVNRIQINNIAFINPKAKVKKGGGLINDSLMYFPIELNEFEILDTITIHIYKGNYHNYRAINEKLGEIRLFKKK